MTMANVRPEALQWLWKGRIPLGTLTIIDGDPGLGKSLVTVDLAARVSRGDAMPDGSPSDLGEPADVLLVFCEDDPAATVRPRLDLAGADVERVHHLLGTEKPDASGVRPLTLADVGTIDAALSETGARLVVVDPWAAYIGGRDSRSDEKMRELLTPLADVARKHHAAIVIVRHLRKASGSAVTSGAGSMGITGAARSVLLVAEDPEDPKESRILAVSKGNLAARAESLTFTVETEKREMPDPSGITRAVDVPRLVWGEASEASADDLITAARADVKDKSASSDAETFILEALEDEPVDADALLRDAERAGHKRRTVERARSKLREAGKIWRYKEGVGAWWWGLGAEPSPEWIAERGRWARAGR